jgi:hypothetical protein
MRTTTAHEAATKTQAPSHHEGPIAKAIESKTSRLPSDLFLWSAGGATTEGAQQLRRPVGADPLAPGRVQQAREAARLRKNRVTRVPRKKVSS